MTKRLLPALLVAALVTGCTKTNPNAALDGGPPGDGPGPGLEGGRPPGTLGGPCLPGGTCNPGLKCQGGICVPVVDGGQWDLGPLPDGPPLLDGPPPPDQGPVCNPVGYRPVLTSTDVTGDWTVVLEPQTKAKTLTITNPKAKQAAALFDHDLGGAQVAGFVVSLQTSYATVVQQATAAVQAMGQQIGPAGSLSLRSAGLPVLTHDGFAALAGLTVDVTLGSPGDISKLRVQAVAGLLGLSVANLGPLPPSFGSSTTKLVLRLAVLLRQDNRTMVIGAVTDRSADDDPSKLTATLSADLASTNLLATAGAGVGMLCDSQSVTSMPKNDVDIIWVMDESGSMDSKRAAIASGAASFFKQLQQTGLDFRMGVTNVCDPGGSFSTAVGKFCSSISTNQNDMGGTDRFLTAGEQTIFSACINNPPGYEPAQEYGLVNAKEAVKRHLPRTAGDPSRIRPGAQVVIIVVTDEAPQGLKNILANTNVLKQCTLNATIQAQVNAHVQPYITYFKGTADPGAQVDYFQVIGGVCNSFLCPYPIDVAHGYMELAQQLGGKVHDVCQSNLGPAVTSILGSIVATASTFSLQDVPIAPSLAVALDGVTLQRSNVSGFRHEAGTKDLAFTGSAKLSLGSTVVASYRLWN